MPNASDLPEPPEGFISYKAAYTPPKPAPKKKVLPKAYDMEGKTVSVKYLSPKAAGKSVMSDYAAQFDDTSNTYSFHPKTPAPAPINPAAVDPSAPIPTFYASVQGTMLKEVAPPAANVTFGTYTHISQDHDDKMAKLKGMIKGMTANVAYIDEEISVPEMIAPQPAKKPVAPMLPDLQNFVLGELPFENFWTPDQVAEALQTQGWRERSIGETILKGDLLFYTDQDGPHYERVQGLENLVFAEEHRAELMNYTVFVCDGVKVSRKPVVIKNTEDFRSIYDVPKGVKVNMPTVEAEAARFFGCNVIRTDYASRGKCQKVYYPVPTQMIDRRFRRAFSRIFSDFTKTHFRECLKGVIPCRGEGIDVNFMRRRGIKGGISVRKIRQMMEAKGKMLKGKLVPLTTKELYEQIQSDTHLDADSLTRLLRRQDYQPLGRKAASNPFVSFLERMSERKLSPDEFKYQQAIGIEIEAISTMNAADLQRRMPHWARVIYDGSLRDNQGAILRAKEAFSSNNFEQKQKEMTMGANGKWGVEFQILVQRRDMDSQISRVLNAIGRAGCWVNKTCGLHVHFDMRDKTQEEAFDLADKVNAWLMILRELLPKDRRHNKYCAFENPDQPHHAAVATDSYAKHKTIEVRVHSGTINPTKILCWIRLLDALIAIRYTPVAKSSCLDTLKMLDISDSDRQYWMKRHHHLNPDQYSTAPDYGYLGGVIEIE